MSDQELIAHQAKRIEELKIENSDLKNRISNACNHIYCIGGPLNDNKLQYTQKQLVTFSEILTELEY